MSPPVVVLGVSRSGTTLLKEMLDAHSELAIPTESYFIPQLAGRHDERLNVEDFLADLGRLARVREWGVSPEDVRRRLPDEPTFPEAVQAIYLAYADARGKRRYGDKTPAYMQQLDLLAGVFPTAQYVHLIRDGRDAGLSFVAMRRRPRFNWARPRGLAAFACQWKLEVAEARRFGRSIGPERYLELRYEDLVAEPEANLRRACEFLGLEFEAVMLEYHRAVDAARLADHPRLTEPPTPGVRRWREQMSPADAELFEAIAGPLLTELGHERAFPRPSPRAIARARAVEAAFRVRLLSWTAALAVVRRSPAWRVRQAYIRRTARA
jgi:hypothetical protein